MQNDKVLYETLFNVIKRQMIEGTDENLSVKQLIRKIKINGANLFLGIHQGCGQFTNDAHVVINPIRKKEAISWIVHGHVLVKIRDGFVHKTSTKKMKLDK